MGIDSKYKTLKDLVEYAKKNPGIVTVRHSGAGSARHLVAAMKVVEENPDRRARQTVVFAYNGEMEGQVRQQAD